MERNIYRRLLSWKRDKKRKPLILKGARQTGKTYLLKKFGTQEYKDCHYFNFEETPEIKDLFINNLKPEHLLPNLELYSKKKIHAKTDLIIFDEIQSCDGALTSLKYFNENAHNYHIAAAGSLLGLKLSKGSSFPVGKVNLFNIYPLTFSEFLSAIGEQQYLIFIQELSSKTNSSEVFHKHLIEYLRCYYFTGGMPEVVKEYRDSKDLAVCRNIQKEILTTYELDFAKHAKTIEIPKISLLWESVPGHLSRENKKFVFSSVKKSARARDYESSLQWLMDAGLIYKTYATERARGPLQANLKKDIFKIYHLDVGLLGAMVNMSSDILLQKNMLFNTYHGAFVENYVATHLKAIREETLIYWKSEGKKAEVDFLIENNGHIYPLEVKAGINTKSKSLKSFSTQFHPPKLLRISLLPLHVGNNILNIPLYALPELERLMHL
ncbi:MAG: ATP-binding protein [Fibrobacteria bacterium]|nr:ATP-binding protein [Fibrobacteria bacterium]